jgi:Mg/Co/Ni transporter MgtE
MVGAAGYARAWIFGAFVPPMLIKFTDWRFTDYTELENFYKYVDERRKGEYIEKLNSGNVNKALAGADNSAVVELKDELIRNNKTIYDVVNDLDAAYLKAATDLMHK